MTEGKIYKKIVTLNASMDILWVSFAIYVWALMDVPFYIAMAPVLYSLFSYVYGARMVRNHNTITPGVNGSPEVYNKDRQKVDDMLYTIAQQNP
jgi:hypothetical protein